jgi:hypothetical protein
MASFAKDVLEAAANEREVTLTTRGRQTGKARRVTIWLATDGHKIFIRSGQGLVRHWPQNLMAQGEGVLHVGGHDVKVRGVIMEVATARAVSELYRKKYGSSVKPSKPTESPTKGELATFELVVAED